MQTITEEHMDRSNKDKEPPQDRHVNEEQDSSTLSDESLSHTQISINKDQQLHTSFENTQATPKTSEDQQQLHPETQIQCQKSKDAVEQSGYGEFRTQNCKNRKKESERTGQLPSYFHFCITVRFCSSQPATEVIQ